MKNKVQKLFTVGIVATSIGLAIFMHAVTSVNIRSYLNSK